MNPSNFGSGDSTDARGLFWSSKPDPPMGNLPVALDSEVYNMDHPKRGKCIIFNNKDFDSNTRLSTRNGTDCDADALYQTFSRLDFTPEKCKDFSAHKIQSALKEVAKEDHSKQDCFVCCVLSHGEEGLLYGKDGKFLTENIFKPFEASSCVTLAGKPKIFFIQACQGDKLDSGTKLKIESADSGAFCKIPNRADFLIVYSTVPGYYSWRNTANGSWFIQSLCKVLDEHSHNMDLLSMMTLVNREVAYNFQSSVWNDPSMDKMKQVPCVTSTLTRKVYFPPKP